MTKKVSILSIDGGGIRGIISAFILSEIEKLIKLKTGNQESCLIDYVDYVAGTSSGGILGAALLIPHPEKPLKPKFSLNDITGLFYEHGDAIFKKSLWHNFRTFLGIREALFSNENLKQLLLNNFSTTYLSELIRPCLFTAYDVEGRQAFFFKQSKARLNEQYDFQVKDICLAISATPAYFETAKIQSKSNEHFALIDGGVYANNPAMCAYTEARKSEFGEIINPSSSEILMISVGTGFVKQPIPYETTRRFGLVQWIRPLIDVMMSGNSETVSHQLRCKFEVSGNADNYFRLESTLEGANPDLTDTSKENLNKLLKAGEIYMETHLEKINLLIDKLIENKTELIN